MSKIYWVCRRTMVAFNSGGSANPVLPPHLIPARMHGFWSQRRASDPFNSTNSRSSSTTPTTQHQSGETEPWQSMADLMRTSASVTAGAAGATRPAAELHAALTDGQSIDNYLRTASLPHVPTQPLIVNGLKPPAETPAMANPRKWAVLRLLSPKPPSAPCYTLL